MTVIIQMNGQDEEFVEDVAAVVFEYPNSVRICRESQEDWTIWVDEPRVAISVVP